MGKFMNISLGLKKAFLASTVAMLMILPVGMLHRAHAAYTQSSFSSSSYMPSSGATYTLKFLAPKDLVIQFIGVSFANSSVDLSNASLAVSGISGGTPTIDYKPGISGNQDFQYKLSSPVTMSQDTWITLQVTGAKNPPSGTIGWDYINVSDNAIGTHDTWYTYNASHDPDMSIMNNVYKQITAPTPTPTPTSIPKTPTVTKAPAPTGYNPRPPAPTKQLSFFELLFWEIFYFDGSLTTDIKSIKDPTKVKDFTLDTKEWTVVFSGEYDMTDQMRLNALSDLKSYWTADAWNFLIKWEWWNVFGKPIEVTQKNPHQTGYAPDVKLNDPALPEASASVKSTKQGSLVIQATGPGKITVMPKVSMIDQGPIISTDGTASVRLKTSHDNIIVVAKVNGETITYDHLAVNKETGEVSIPFEDLRYGDNSVELYYRMPGDDTLKDLGKVSIGSANLGQHTYVPKKSDVVFPYWWLICICPIFLVLFLIAIIILIITQAKKIKNQKTNQLTN